MTVCKVLSTLPVGEDTAVVVEGAAKLFKNGTGILDESGKPYVVLSVGMEGGHVDLDDVINKECLLIEGKFSSKKLFV